MSWRSALVLLLLLPAAAVAQEVGPDASGLRAFPTTYAPVSPPEGVPGLDLDDSDAVDVLLPWIFPFHGEGHLTLSVSLQGAVRLGAGGEVNPANECLPADPGPDDDAPDIAVYWANLVAGSSGEVHAWHDLVRNVFVVSWDRVRMPGLGSGSFQLHLLPNGEFEVHFEDLRFGSSSLSFGGGATVGAQDTAGGTWSSGNALLLSCNQTNVLDEEAAWVFSRCVDEDGDGERDEACGGTDCDDDDPARRQGSAELCDGLDSDCDGLPLPTEVDVDEDGWLACEDCDDLDGLVYPGAPERCNGKDDDCDGLAGTHEGFPDATDEFTDGERLRGTLWHMQENTLLGSIEAWVEAPEGTTITYLVYESRSEAGPFERVLGILGVTEGEGMRWHASPALEVQMWADRYYVTAVYFNDALRYGWNDEVDLPRSMTFGEALNGVSQNFLEGPPALLDAERRDRLYAQRHVFLDELDGDGDGALWCGDCDDEDASSGPDAAELCDGEDRDCDGLVDEEDPDCLPPADDDDDDSAPAEDPSLFAPLAEEGCQTACDGAGLMFGAQGSPVPFALAFLCLPFLRRRRE